MVFHARLTRRFGALAAVCSALCATTCAAPKPSGPSQTPPPRPVQAPPPVAVAAPDPAAPAGQPWSPIQSDFPFQSSCVTAPQPANNVIHKSVSIRLPGEAAVAFDTDLLRVGAGWTGKFLTPTGVTFDTSHGGHPHVAGAEQFGTKPGPGWADARGRFDDPRKPQAYGPLPESWARWNGLHVAGDAVVLDYTVLGTKVLEQPSAVTRDGRTLFVRTLHIAKADRPLSMVVLDAAPEAVAKTVAWPGGAPAVSFVDGTGVLTAAVLDAPAGAKLEVLKNAAGRLVLRLPRLAKASTFKVVVSRAEGAEGKEAEVLPALAAAAPPMADIRAGGPAHWPSPIVTKGELGQGPGPYVVDRLTTPFPGVYKGAPDGWRDNVFKRRIMIAGLDFFSDGKRAAVSTWEGDVWIVSGIDDKLDRLSWRRFASGGFETLGLKIVNDVVYTTGRDQITRYHDLNNDGEADHYENFNNQVFSTTGFHEFQFDLQTDKAGNFYTSKAAPVRNGGRGFGGGGGNGEITKFSGTVQKISKDGRKREIIATGLRAPNGIGVGPDGQITSGDNEGTWMPACPIHWIKPGGFQGVEDVAPRKPAPKPELPLCWLSKAYDNSGGGQVWVDSDKWGPFKGELLHLSYGRSSVYLVLKEKIAGQMQGGVVRLVGGTDAVQFTGTPTKLTSAAMRGRFNPVDGQLYVAGLAGWQTDAVALTGFDRIRYTGAPVTTVRGLKVTAEGVELTFSDKLDPKSVDPQNVSGERWNYKRTSAYGSPEFSVSEPEQTGHDMLDVLEARLGGDGHTVTVVIDDLRPANQMLLRFRFKTLEGKPIAQTIMHTIHKVPVDPRAKGAVRVARKGKPGLETSFAALADNAAPADVTVSPQVSLFVAAGKSASPLLPPGPFRTTWEGTVSPEMRGTVAFEAAVSGHLVVTVNGKTVLDATGKGETGTPVQLDRGDNAFRAVFESPNQGDAFVRLSWRTEGSSTAEPLSARAFRHEPSPAAAQAKDVRSGRALFLEHRCARCHASALSGATMEAASAGPSLDGIGARLNTAWMKDWIGARYRPTFARMPSLLRGRTGNDEAGAMAAFLATQAGGPGAAADPAPALAATGEALWETLNCGGCHSPLINDISDDGKMPILYVLRKYRPGALAAYLRAPEAHHALTRMPNFHLTAEEADALAAHLISRSQGVRRPEPASTPELVKAGEALIEGRGCLSCHSLSGHKSTLAAPALFAHAPAAENRRNCIDGAEAFADYHFNPAQKAALNAFVRSAQGLASLTRHAPMEFIARKTKELRCDSCHGRLEGFPDLDILGAKLRPEWAAAFIGGQVPYKPRPAKHADGQTWLEARMPAFPGWANALAEGLAVAHGLPPHSPAQTAANPALAKVGARLVGTDGGFACITCHAVGNSPATQVFESEGINLAHAADRLLPVYFARWLRNPLKIDPHTKMPAYFDDSGTSPLPTVLDGKADSQIEALWQYVKTLRR